MCKSGKLGQMGVKPGIRLGLRLAQLASSGRPEQTIAELRAAEPGQTRLRHRLAGRPAEVAAATDLTVPVDGGEITVRVYRPFGAGPFPSHVFAHGGSFSLGTLDEYDPLCREYCTRAGCVVVSVEYRLAPEHTWPTAPEDVYRALTWTVENAAALDIDGERVSVGGTSAGASLAAATTLMARDRGGPSIVFQLLEIPALDCTMSQPSIDEFAEGYLLTRANMAKSVGRYLSDPAHAHEPYASPLLAADLTGLPPARILTCEFDPLRDEGEAYGRRLAEAGVPTVVSRYNGHIHSSTYATRVFPSARRHIAEACAALSEAYATEQRRR